MRGRALKLRAAAQVFCRLRAAAQVSRRLSAAVLGAGVLALTPSVVRAQQCTVTSTPTNVPASFAQDACVKTSDVFSFLAPQVGVALSGGNVMLGEGGTLGGWGKRSAVLRITAVDGRVPANDITLSTSGPQSSNFGAERAPVPVPSLDVAIGVFRGVPVGLTNVGGVDLIVGVTAIPSVSRDRFAVDRDGGGIAATFGVRVGILQESALVPGVGLSVMRRRLPTTSISYYAGNDTLRVMGNKFSTTSIRLAANKRFGLFAIGGGIGEDRLSARSSVEAILNESVQGVPARAVATLSDLRDDTKRGTAFLNASVGLAMAQLVLEVGQSRAGDIRETLNTFGDRRANEAYRYGSIGFGIRF